MNVCQKLIFLIIVVKRVVEKCFIGMWCEESGGELLNREVLGRLWQVL